MKKAWPSDTWPATPDSRLMPSAAMAKITAWVSSRIQSGSPMKRTIGSWLITGSENGSSTATSSSSTSAMRCVQVGKIAVSAL